MGHNFDEIYLSHKGGCIHVYSIVINTIYVILEIEKHVHICISDFHVNFISPKF